LRRQHQGIGTPLRGIGAGEGGGVGGDDSHETKRKFHETSVNPGFGGGGVHEKFHLRVTLKLRGKFEH
jgi:hypothetical protein